MKTNSPGILYDRLVENQDCLDYAGAITDYGYGSITIKGKSHRTHRVMWELEKGPIPAGLNVLHTCDNPACCNIEHLFLGTQQDNVDDMIEKGRDSFGENIGTKNGSARLCEEDIHQIRKLLSEGQTQEYIAQIYNVHRKCISKIKNRQTWGWLT